MMRRKQEQVQTSINLKNILILILTKWNIDFIMKC